MKLRSFFVFLAASVVVLLLIGGGCWLWLLAHSPLTLLQGRQVAPSAAIFIPRQAPAMVSLLVNPDRLVALRQVVAAPGARRRSRSELNQLRQSFLASTDLDYESDIRPWLGEEITLAVTTLDIDRQPENGQQPGYLLALETRDVEETQAFLHRFWDRSANLSEQYQGVKLISAQPEVTSGQPDQGQGRVTATAVVGRLVLFANHSQVLRSAINTAQVPDLGLDQASSYRRVLASFQQGWVGLTWLNPQANQQAVKPAAQTSEIAIALGLNRQGILAESALITAAATANQPAVPGGQVLKYIPATCPFAISGIDLDQLWSDISTGLLSNDWVANLVNPSLSELKTRWGLDLPQDIFAWVKGEYAIAMLPSTHQGQPGSTSRPDWLFVAERNEPEVQQAMQHLDAVAEQQGLGVGPLAVAGQKISAWTQLVATAQVPAVAPGILQARVVGTHRAIDNYQVLATSLEAVAQVQASDHLSESDNFKRAIAPLPTPSDGYLYLDWPASRLLLEQQFPVLRALEVAGQSFFSHLRSVSLNSYGTEAGVLRGKIFVRLRSLVKTT